MDLVVSPLSLSLSIYPDFAMDLAYSSLSLYLSLSLRTISCVLS